MKNMKTTLLLLCIGIMQAVAQGPRGGHHHEGGENYLAKLDSIVHLTDDQKAKIESIQTEYKEKFKAVRESNSEPDRSAMQRLREEQQTKIKAVLTPEQQALLEEDIDERKQNMKKMHEEIKSYRSTNIFPVMSRLHTEFENELTVDEKSKIESVKKEVKAMKKRYYALNGDSTKHGTGAKEMAGKSGKRPHGKHGKGLTKEQREAVHTYASTELKPILDAHKAILDKTMNDLKPLQDTWKADLKAIQSKYDANKGARKGHKNGKKSGKKDQAKDSTDREDWAKIKFILKGFDEDKDH